MDREPSRSVPIQVSKRREELPDGFTSPGGTFYASSSFSERTTFYDDPDDERLNQLFMRDSRSSSPSVMDTPLQFEVEVRRNRPFLIGITGGSASGKIIDIGGLESSRVAVVSQDSFYRPLTPKEHHEANSANFNFDHPNAFDTKMMIELLERLRSGQPIDAPIYNFVTHSREPDRFDHFDPVDFILVEGIMTFVDPGLRKLFDMRIFVETDDDIRLIRRIRRDMSERGRSLEGVLSQYEKFVKPAYENFILPTKKYADIVLPRGGQNKVAVKLIVDYIHFRLSRNGAHDQSERENEVD